MAVASEIPEKTSMMADRESAPDGIHAWTLRPAALQPQAQIIVARSFIACAH
jgi:hypothetical protein